ncbi:MAG: hypothetical protein WBE18_07540, partial [Gammaproteobacteria bacterium]
MPITVKDKILEIDDISEPTFASIEDLKTEEITGLDLYHSGREIVIDENIQATADVIAHFNAINYFSFRLNEDVELDIKTLQPILNVLPSKRFTNIRLAGTINFLFPVLDVLNTEDTLFFEVTDWSKIKESDSSHMETIQHQETAFN